MNKQKIHRPLLLESLEARLGARLKPKPRPDHPVLTEREEVALASGARLIALNKDKWAIVDPEDYDLFSKFRWNVQKPLQTEYAVCKVFLLNRTHKSVTMHGCVMTPPLGLVIDHKSGDGLDNRRQNLRFATYAQNTHNRRISSKNTSGYKGVTLSKAQVLRGAKKIWKSAIMVNGELIFLGYFENAVDAYQARCDAALELHGEFARLR